MLLDTRPLMSEVAMHPVLKRILVHGGLTAAVLALVGVLFAELAGIWTAGGAGRPGSVDLNPQPPEALRYRIPLTMALAGFLFVAVGELIKWRVRGNAPPASAAMKSPAPQPDDAEKLLNELLAQSEAKMAQEAANQKVEGAAPAPGTGDQKTENGERKPEGSGQQPDTGHKAEAGEDTRRGPSVL
jgi:hypothetical protein